jgi:hypothetical protein
MNQENPYRGAGIGAMKKDGLSQQERAVSENENDSFEQRLEKSRRGAEIIMEHSKYVTAIEQFAQRHRDSSFLTEKDCELFLKEHPNCPYETSLVLAITERIQSAPSRVLH